MIYGIIGSGESSNGAADGAHNSDTKNDFRITAMLTNFVHICMYISDNILSSVLAHWLLKSNGNVAKLYRHSKASTSKSK
jgi:hypothetical protein